MGRICWRVVRGLAPLVVLLGQAFALVGPALAQEFPRNTIVVQSEGGVAHLQASRFT